MKPGPSKSEMDLMHKNPSNWRGIFYYNKKDPRLIVPKSNPAFGWTFNFASPKSIVFMVVLLLIIITSIYFDL